MVMELVVNSAPVSDRAVLELSKRPIDQLPIYVLIPAAVLGVLLGRFAPVATVLMVPVLIGLIIRNIAMRLKYRKLERVAQIHEKAERLGNTIADTFGKLEKANENLGFAEAKYGTQTLKENRLALEDRYAKMPATWDMQAQLLAYDGANIADPNHVLIQVEEICRETLAEVDSQTAVIQSCDNSVANASAVIAALDNSLGNFKSELVKTKAQYASLELTNKAGDFEQVTSDITQVHSKIAGAKKAHQNGDYGKFLQTIKDCDQGVGRIKKKLTGLNAYGSRIADEREKARQEAERIAAQQKEAARLARERQRRDNAIQSALESVSGLGPKRREAILQHFGSLEAVRVASPQALEKVPTIGPGLAQAISTAMLRVR
jgi:chromosome segregation ATPase